MKINSIILISIFWCFKLNALNYSITQYSSLNGVNLSNVRALVQDSIGFVWVGTENGLIRFDGKRFKKITAPVGYTVVNDITVGPDDKIFVKWRNFPVIAYLQKEGKWQKLDSQHPKISADFELNNENSNAVDNLINLEILSPKLHDYLLENHIEDFYYKLLKDKIIVATDKKIIHYDLLNEKYNYISLPTKDDQIISLAKIKNNIYACLTNEIFKLINNEKLELVYRHNNKKNHQQNYCIRHKNEIVFSANKEGIKSINTESKVTVNYYNENFNTLNFLTHFRRMYSDNSSLWFFIDQHIFEFDGILNNHYKNEKKINLSIFIDNPIITLTDGSMLIGTPSSGLLSISKIKNKFTTIKPPLKGDPSFRQAVLLDNELWISSVNGGVFRWKRQSNQWNHYELNNLKISRTNSIIKDKYNNIWVGTTNGALLKYEKKEDTFKLVVPEAKAGYGMNSLIFFNDKIWFESGSVFYNYDVFTKKLLEVPIDLKESEAYRIRVLFSTTNSILIGTHGEGVLEIDPQGKILNHWKSELLSKDVFSLYEDSFNNIWVGTWGGGLTRINSKTDEIQIFNSQNGLNDNTVFGILPGNENELWLSSYNGLMQFKKCINNKWPCKPSVKFYNEHDGLQQNEFDADAFALFDTGELYFAGVDGINIFKPIDFHQYTTPPSMSITEVYIDNQSYHGDLNEIVLEHDHNKIQIDFIAFDYHDPNSLQYQYNFNDKWVSLESPKIEFLNLSSGNYFLKLRGSNHDGVWASKPLKINIRVKPPYYYSWEALLAYFIIFLGMLFFIIQKREEALKKEKSKLEILVSKRTKQINENKNKLKKAYIEQNRLYSSISHEIKTPLTILLAPIEEISHGHELKLESLKTMQRQAKNLKFYLNNLLTLTALKSIKNLDFGAHEIEPYLVSLIDDFKYLAEQKNIQLTLDLGTKKNTSVKSVKRSLNIIMNNLLDNAIKQTPDNGAIQIRTSQSGSLVIISVIDSGFGVPEEEQNNIFEFGESNNNTSQWLNSLGIGLSTSQEIAKLLGGTITIRNIDHGGACFSVTLPLASETLNKIDDNTNTVPQNIIYSNKPHKQTKSKDLILIIDDNPEILSMITDQLSPHYNVFATTTGLEGKTFILKYLPDLVICDVMLPDINGYTLLKEFKDDIATDSIPIIIMTSMNEEVSKLRSMELYADAHISKPYAKKELILTIQNLLHRNKLIRSQILHKIYSTSTKDKDDSNKEITILERILSIVNKNYTDQNFNARQLANKMNMSISTLQRKLKNETQLTIGQIIFNFRIDKSKQLIKVNIPITEVALQCGFASSSHFSTRFLSITKMTPSQYRNQLKRACK